jgi:hypothetical protein
MRIIWQVDAEDVAKTKVFVQKQQDNPLVKDRIESNLRKDKPPVSKEDFWYVMVGCLLTTQQRSGPSSSVARFLRVRPFPSNYAVCHQQKEIAGYTQKVLAQSGGLRRSTTIGNEVAANLQFLEHEGWSQTFKHLDCVRVDSQPETERRAADFIDQHFKGFGPKQSRNLLQWLGLSRFEIPIDSRITKWLNEFGFPVRLTANALGDVNYCNFVSDGFQRLAEACGIMPCVLDAAIFSSFDGDGWTDENVVWSSAVTGNSVPEP